MTPLTRTSAHTWCACPAIACLCMREWTSFAAAAVCVSPAACMPGGFWARAAVPTKRASEWHAATLDLLPNLNSRLRAAQFVPFIQGPRNCLGQFFALLEARVVLALLVKVPAIRLSARAALYS